MATQSQIGEADVLRAELARLQSFASEEADLAALVELAEEMPEYTLCFVHVYLYSAVMHRFFLPHPPRSHVSLPFPQAAMHRRPEAKARNSEFHFCIRVGINYSLTVRTLALV